MKNEFYTQEAIRRRRNEEIKARANQIELLFGEERLHPDQKFLANVLDSQRLVAAINDIYSLNQGTDHSKTLCVATAESSSRAVRIGADPYTVYDFQIQRQFHWNGPLRGWLKFSDDIVVPSLSQPPELRRRVGQVILGQQNEECIVTPFKSEIRQALSLLAIQSGEEDASIVSLPIGREF